MKRIILITFLITTASCSTLRRLDPSHPRYEDPLEGIRIYQVNENWKPEKNCKFIRYTSVYSPHLRRSSKDFERGLDAVSLRVQQMGGTVAKIRDYTNDKIFFYSWFCSYKY